MKSRYFKILAITLALAVITAIAVSQTAKRAHMRGMYGGEMFGGHMLGFLAHKLDLSGAQQAQVKEILAKEKPALQPLMLQMAQSHQQLRQLEMSGSFDEAKVRELASQQTRNVTELIVQKARIGSELVQILTPEQKAKLSDLMTQHEQRFMNHIQGQGQTQSQ